MKNKKEKSLNFFITLNKITGELTLQEGALVNFKIPKHWQKLDPSPRSSALWVCHLPANPLEIDQVSFYPTELVIKKKKTTNEREDYEKELEEYEKELEEMGADKKEEDFLIYKGTLEFNGENEKETFFRCELRLQKEKEEKSESSGAIVFAIIFIIVLIFVILAFKGFN